jgi:hypothetical protein
MSDRSGSFRVHVRAVRHEIRPRAIDGSFSTRLATIPPRSDRGHDRSAAPLDQQEIDVRRGRSSTSTANAAERGERSIISSNQSGRSGRWVGWGWQRVPSARRAAHLARLQY